jgi:hypothetical protein
MNTSMHTVWVRGDLLVWYAEGTDGPGCSGRRARCRASVFGRTMAADVDAALARLPGDGLDRGNGGPRVADGDRRGARPGRDRRWVGSERLDAGKEIADQTSIAIAYRGSVRASKTYYPKSTPG